ncbi:MAG: hydrogenase iron-sulfur subunit [Deltaproteobacteria bacterium]|nr:hydrogenase iron-sulfur subunit [Deltaproteobacteria bacterium]
MRLHYPDCIRIIRVPCTGKVDILHILRSFEKGADGVYVVGCLEGDCRFERGNLRARKRVEKAGEILEAVGIGGQRVRMFNLSSGDGPRFAEIAREMTELIKEIGPNPIKLKKKKQAA